MINSTNIDNIKGNEKKKNIKKNANKKKKNNPPKKKQKKITKVKNITNNNNYYQIPNIPNALNINARKNKKVIETQINDGSNILNINSTKKKAIKKENNVMKYTDEELNELSYNLALKYDKRTYSMYYCSLLRTKHIFIFSFFSNNDYNSRIIKYDLFFITFAIYYAVNAPFFNDELMHNIYEKKGTFDFIYNLPQIIYSSLISIVLNMLLKLLSLSNKDIINFKVNKSKEDIKQRENSLKLKLKIKFILFFILGFILLLFIWYYLSIFSAIYRNTQVYLLKNTLISYSLSLIYPFGIYLIPGLFRIPGLARPKNKGIYLYKVSKVLQILQNSIYY